MDGSDSETGLKDSLGSQILQKPQMRKLVLTADLRERFAKNAKYAANAAKAADSEQVFGDERLDFSPYRIPVVGGGGDEKNGGGDGGDEMLLFQLRQADFVTITTFGGRVRSHRRRLKPPSERTKGAEAH